MRLSLGKIYSFFLRPDNERLLGLILRASASSFTCFVSSDEVALLEEQCKALTQQLETIRSARAKQPNKPSSEASDKSKTVAAPESHVLEEIKTTEEFCCALKEELETMIR